jgi:hypothetical protein
MPTITRASQSQWYRFEVTVLRTGEEHPLVLGARHYNGPYDDEDAPDPDGHPTTKSGSDGLCQEDARDTG